MRGLEEIASVVSILYSAAYGHDQSEKEAYAIHPGKKSGGTPSEIGIRNPRAGHLIDRLDRDLHYTADLYLKRLEES